MTMKVTKRCTPPDAKIWHGKCATCKSEATALGKELDIRPGEYGRGPAHAWAKCPVCGADRPSFCMLFHEKSVEEET